MKLLTLIIVLSLLTPCFGQDSTKCYKSFSAYKKGTPSYTVSYMLKERTLLTNVAMGKIGEYSFQGIQPSNLRKELRKEMWGITQDSTLFINLYSFTKYKVYSKVLGYGKYKYFVGTPPAPLDGKNQRKLGIIGEKGGAVAIPHEVGYVLFPDGSVKFLNKTLLLELVNDFETLSGNVVSADFKNRSYSKMFKVIDELNNLLGL